MPPASLYQPSGVTFLEDQAPRPVNVDAATYYGGREHYHRSRTYSQVYDYGYLIYIA